MGTGVRDEPGGLREHRRHLHRAMIDLEQAATAAAARPIEFRDRLAATLGRLESTIEDHVSWTEGEGGLFDQVVDVDPRLDAKVHRLRQEHDALADATTRLLARCRGEVPTPDDVEDVRDDVLALLTQLVRHRQRGADLLYEAYAVDVSVGD